MYCQVYFLANTTVVGFLFLPDNTSTLPFPTSYRTRLVLFCLRSCSSSSFSLLCVYSLSLSVLLLLLSISEQETFRVYTNQHPS